MKYENKIQEYINNNGKIGERHEEPKANKVSDPVANSGISKEIKKEEPFYELAEKMIQKEDQQKATPKKQRGRPVGSKTTKKKTRRTRTPHISETNLTVGMSQELFDDIQKAATHNFRTLANEVCWVLTQYYNGKL